MNFDEIVARLIRRSVEQADIRSHERVLLRRYDVSQAQRIAAQLLQNTNTTAVVGLPGDDGSLAEVHLPVARWTTGSRAFELLPFVVTPTPHASEPAWVGSQGYASRLRTSFHLLAPSNAARVLVLFDQSPVETEQ